VEAILRFTKITNKGFWRAVVKLLKSWNYMILVTAYGINVGVFNSFSTLLNQIVLNYFPNSEADAGKVGMALIVVGLVGSVVFGFFMDTLHKFKETALWVCKLTAITMVMFCLALESRSKILLSVASILLGFDLQHTASIIHSKIMNLMTVFS
jgi:MFS transporter, FLVCR family, feline leukemia virus subgroup C receptor-related protein